MAFVFGHSVTFGSRNVTCRILPCERVSFFDPAPLRRFADVTDPPLRAAIDRTWPPEYEPVEHAIWVTDGASEKAATRQLRQRVLHGAHPAAVKVSRPARGPVTLLGPPRRNLGLVDAAIELLWPRFLREALLHGEPLPPAMLARPQREWRVMAVMIEAGAAVEPRMLPPRVSAKPLRTPAPERRRAFVLTALCEHAWRRRVEGVAAWHALWRR